MTGRAHGSIFGVLAMRGAFLNFWPIYGHVGLFRATLGLPRLPSSAKKSPKRLSLTLPIIAKQKLTQLGVTGTYRANSTGTPVAPNIGIKVPVFPAGKGLGMRVMFAGRTFASRDAGGSLGKRVWLKFGGIFPLFSSFHAFCFSGLSGRGILP